MIQNIILLLVTNTFLPYFLIPSIPVPLLAPLPILQSFIEPPSALESMNLSRLYKPDEFRTAFKQALRVHHPDSGGSQDVFQQIQGLKKIMSRQVNYYDLYNLTDADISSGNLKFEEIVDIKKYTYYVETGVFYFIAFVFVLAFTIQSHTKTPRRLMIALTIAFAAYQVYSHENPQIPTVIDFLDNKVPLFLQFQFMKRTLIVWLALIRAYFERKKSEETQLLDTLKKQKRQLEEYRDILQRLKVINLDRLKQKEKYEKSWLFKIQNWIGKIISFLFFLLVIKNMIPGLNML